MDVDRTPATCRMDETDVYRDSIKASASALDLNLMMFNRLLHEAKMSFMTGS